MFILSSYHIGTMYICTNEWRMSTQKKNECNKTRQEALKCVLRSPPIMG